MVSFTVLTIVMWSLVGLCILLTVGRYAIRYRISMRLYRDDFTHLCALGWLIIFAALTQALFTPTQLILQSKVLQTPAAPSAIAQFCRLQTAQGTTFYLLHWTVKLAFLLFYRELFWVSSSFIRAWWWVVTFVLLGLGVAMAGILTQRGPISKIDDPTTCAIHNPYQKTARIYIFVANVSTDLAVMFLPLNMLRKLPIHKTQKLGLALVFSVCIFTIALELFRFIKNILGDDSTNNILYAIINANLTIVISCIPTYRSLWKLWRKARANASLDQISTEDSAHSHKQKIASNFDWSDSVTQKQSIPLRAYFQTRESRSQRLLDSPGTPPWFRP